jgi:site-specific recombinase XerD
VGQYLDQWLKDERAVISEEMAQKYARVIRQFLACVGHKSMREVSAGDVARFRDQLLKQGLAPKTINARLGSLKCIFRVAYESGAIDRNPVALVRSVKTETVSDSTFTPEQIHKLVDAAEGDWKGLILAGFYTGARLMDLARLEWPNVSEYLELAQTWTRCDERSLLNRLVESFIDEKCLGYKTINGFKKELYERVKGCKTDQRRFSGDSTLLPRQKVSVVWGLKIKDEVVKDYEM